MNHCHFYSTFPKWINRFVKFYRIISVFCQFQCRLSCWRRAPIHPPSVSPAWRGFCPLKKKSPNQVPAGDAWEKLRISPGTNQIKRNKKSHLLIKMAWIMFIIASSQCKKKPTYNTLYLESSNTIYSNIPPFKLYRFSKPYLSSNCWMASALLFPDLQ